MLTCSCIQSQVNREFNWGLPCQKGQNSQHSSLCFKVLYQQLCPLSVYSWKMVKDTEIFFSISNQIHDCPGSQNELAQQWPKCRTPGLLIGVEMKHESVFTQTTALHKEKQPPRSLECNGEKVLVQKVPGKKLVQLFPQRNAVSSHKVPYFVTWTLYFYCLLWDRHNEG